MEMDRVSALPDDLLIRIVSHHNLSLKEAANTCLLSKRWRFILTDLPFLSFREGSGQIERFKAGVEGALGNRRGSALECLSLAFCYDNSMASDVDAWVESAAKNKVQHLALDFGCRHRDGDGDGDGDDYSLHGSMCSNNSWLKRLTLGGCRMGMPMAAVEWPSLTQLSFRATILPQQAIDNILSGCPALSRLALHRCRGFNRLEIGGRRFRTLHVEFHNYGTLLEVSAPYMTHLYYGGDIEARTLRLTNVVSLQKLELYTIVFQRDPASLIPNAYQLFHTIGCANTLLLRSDHTLQVVSMMSSSGWQLPQFKLKELIIYSDSDLVETRGAILVLQSSPFLETLTIYDDGGLDNMDPPVKHHNLNCDLLDGKIQVSLQINTPMGTYSTGESSELGTNVYLQNTLVRCSKDIGGIVFLSKIFTQSKNCDYLIFN